MITAKLDVTKITKERLYQGKKGTYLSITLVPTPNSDYGDYMVVESTTKEERDKGIKGAILGNGKKFGQSNGQPVQSNSQDDLPF